MQDVEKLSGGRVRIGAGTLYTALNTLLNKGLIEQAPVPDGADSRRKMYAITEIGKQVGAARSTGDLYGSGYVKTGQKIKGMDLE